MKLELENKVVLITGASAGIGLATAHAFAVEGSRVVLASRRQDALEEAAFDIRERHPQCQVAVVAADLATSAGAAAAVEAATAAFGRLDVLVNNHNLDNHQSFDELTDEEFEDGLQAKPLGYIRLCKRAVPIMKAQQSGVILNVVGMAGKQSPGPPWYPLGMITDAALLAFTKSMADELGPEGIRVLAVNPGPIRTARSEMFHRRRAELSGASLEETLKASAQVVPLRHYGAPSQVADVIVFLCSSRADFVTGTSLLVDGGLCRAIT